MGVSDLGVGDSPLGTCPNCEAAIPRVNLLISYEAEGEWPRLFAECPSCGDPVHPE